MLLIASKFARTVMFDPFDKQNCSQRHVEIVTYMYMGTYLTRKVVNKARVGVLQRNSYHYTLFS